MERLDLYYNEYIKTGETVIRGESYPKDMKTMIVFASIFNPEGKMLIQKRSMKKKGWPGAWDVSAAGANMAGESSLDAICRETKEELGLSLDKKDFSKILSIYYENSIHDIFVAKSDVSIDEIVLQEEEVECAIWASEEEVMKMIDRGEFIPVYKEFIGLLFRMRSSLGIMSK